MIITPTEIFAPVVVVAPMTKGKKVSLRAVRGFLRT